MVSLNPYLRWTLFRSRSWSTVSNGPVTQDMLPLGYPLHTVGQILLSARLKVNATYAGPLTIKLCLKRGLTLNLSVFLVLVINIRKNEVTHKT